MPDMIVSMMNAPETPFKVIDDFFMANTQSRQFEPFRNLLSASHSVLLEQLAVLRILQALGGARRYRPQHPASLAARG